MELALFAISALLSTVSAVTVASLYVWPWLRTTRPNQALSILIVPHLFLRFIGLSLLVPGVVAAALPPAFTVPAAYGDLIAGVMAIVATIGLARQSSWARVTVWLFNTWGTADLIYAVGEGVRSLPHPGALGAAFFLPTAIVPPLLVTHAAIFLILIRSNGAQLNTTSSDRMGAPAHG
jgi:hypothetical protein